MNESSDELKGIVAAVIEVNEIVALIAGVSAEQSEDIRSVAQSIVELDGNTQQNSALVEQIAATSHQMRDQVTALNQLSVYFHIREMEAPEEPGSAPVQRPAFLDSMKKELELA